MGRQRDYQLGLYNEFEKLNKKLDALLKENKEQSLTIYELKLEITKYTELIKKLIEENKIEVKEVTLIIKGNSKKKLLIKNIDMN